VNTSDRAVADWPACLPVPRSLRSFGIIRNRYQPQVHTVAVDHRL